MNLWPVGTVKIYPHPEQCLHSADTQFFFLNKESEVTPSGANVLDGNYAVFGYVVSNQEVLPTLKVGDVIESIQVTYGADKLQQKTAA